MSGPYVIVIVDGRNVFYTHGDRNWMHLLGKFDTQRAANKCALRWKQITGREIVH